MSQSIVLRGKRVRRLYAARRIYLFVLPGLLFFLVFRYYPLYFLQIAFRNYRVTRPLDASPWVGFAYFREVFTSVSFAGALENTLILNLSKLLICFPAPIVLALMLNELKSRSYKRVVQTILYLPHFISWVVISSILTNFLSVQGGLINKLTALFGAGPVMFLGEKAYFKPILVLSDLWKESGYGAIIYLSALTAIDPQLYDAAAIDGAGRLQCIWHIALAGIKETIVVMLILRIGSMLSGSFDQVQSLINPQVLAAGDTLDTFVYRLGISQNRYGFAAAAGLFNSAVAAALLFCSDRFAKRLGERGLF
ncbi:MAG TPA: ABC transporter permease subunit [Clostridia bacterium]|nr:ABC transporter permease subunit [Clostridia bacterium]